MTQTLEQGGKETGTHGPPAPAAPTALDALASCLDPTP